MESSRRAVESYWRSRMIDGATSDEDKVTPVYKLEEICELLRSSHASIVKEVSEFILKRLEHKSPIVKQKALRLIKYAVGKSGVEFRREMQRHSVAVRQLIHHKGQLDPLKGDALNKAVRETAQEALSAIFSAEDNKLAPAEDRNKRIQGFGNTNFEMPSENKKSFLSEIVGVGSASIKQGISTLTSSHSLIKNGTGSYKSPNLQRSLTTETERMDRYEPVQYRAETQGKNPASGPWNQASRTGKIEVANGDSNTSYAETKTREERLLETIVTSGGVRLQPTRESIQVFLAEAIKLDALALCRALELKLQSPIWQVRMKAVCVLESILRRKDDEHFSLMASYFAENKEVVVRCSESPQASLREKTNKVLGLLGSEQSGSVADNPEKTEKSEAATIDHMPDLIDTGSPDDYNVSQDTTQNKDGQNLAQSMPLVDDLFGDGSSSITGNSEPKHDDDPFADVSFHTNESKEHADDLFSGMTVEDKHGEKQSPAAVNRNGAQLMDIFGSSFELPKEQESHEGFVTNLMAGLSIEKNTSNIKQKETSPKVQSETLFSDSSNLGSHSNVLNGIFASQTAGMNVNPMFPPGGMPYNIQPGIMFNQPYAAHPLNYGPMGSLRAQQQFLATMANFQNLGNVNMQNVGAAHVAGTNGGYSSPLPDVFQSNFASQTPSSMMNDSKKEETKAFDFISDHLAAARDTKRVI